MDWNKVESGSLYIGYLIYTLSTKLIDKYIIHIIQIIKYEDTKVPYSELHVDKHQEL
jgi:hypothetical protein